MQFIERQWLRFRRSAGIEGEIPDIRAVIAAESTKPVSHRRRLSRRVRQFVNSSFDAHPERKRP
jgi:hypothetical protein